uniref:Uncharacterized protein n=1 Tax=Geladintestivirus 6 TaxID=3233138 RepID=A0AAU8MJD8_9CAUD
MVVSGGLSPFPTFLSYSLLYLLLSKKSILLTFKYFFLYYQ